MSEVVIGNKEERITATSTKAESALARQARLSEILRGAELLIEYSSRNALPPDGIEEADLQALILRMAKARSALTVRGLGEEEEAQFFADYRVLSRAFLPVTVGSIIDSRPDETGHCRRYFWWGSPITPAAAAVRRFALWSLIALFTLLFVQIFWLVGFDLFDRLRVLEKEEPAAKAAHTLATTENQAAKDAVTKAQQSLANATDASTNGDKSETKTTPADGPEGKIGNQKQAIGNDEVLAAQARLTSAQAALNRTSKVERELEEDRMKRAFLVDTATELLYSWSRPFSKIAHVLGMASGDPKKTAEGAKSTSFAKTSPSAPSKKSERSLDDEAAAELAGPERANERALFVVSIAVNALQTYVLPLLYGFLGTCAYVLRQLTIEIRNRTFRREMELSYWLRIFLGILAGLAIGWFLRPDADKDGLIRGLTPFALSFLAGYSVEVLFSGMDKLVSAFGSSSQQSKG